MGLHDDATEASFISPARNSFDIAKMTGVVFLRVSDNCAKPAAHRDIEEAKLLPLSVTGFFVTSMANRLRIPLLMLHGSGTNWAGMK